MIDARVFGVAMDGVTDDTAAIQSALDAAGNYGDIVFFPSGTYAVEGTIEIGDGTSTTRSTKHNGLSIMFEGNGSYESSRDENSGIPRSGVIFKRIGTSTAPVMRVNGPVHNINVLGGLTIDCDGIANIGLDVLSMSNSHWRSVTVFDYLTIGINLYVQEATAIGGNGNAITTGANTWDELHLSAPTSNNAIALKLDGHKVVSGRDVTHNLFRFVKYLISGTGGIGMYWGYCDFNRFGVVVGVVNGTPSAGAAGLHIVGTNVPFKSAASNFIEQWSPGQGVGVTVDTTNGTPRLNFCYMYHLDDGSIPPTADVAPYFGAVVYQANQPQKTVGLWAANPYWRLEDDSNATGPIITYERDSASPAASDSMAQMNFAGRNDAGNFAVYLDILSKLDSPTAGAESGSMLLRARRAGSLVTEIRYGGGVQVGTPTGGGKGTGTVNVAEAYYINNVIGADGTFTTTDQKTVTVTKGLITSIV